MLYWTYARSVDGSDHIGATFHIPAPVRPRRPGALARMLRALFVSF